jgi:hypothetical protein
VPKSQARFWTPAWQTGDDEATRDIAAGRTAVTTTADEFFAELDR